MPATKNDWRLFCPLMKELCINGHTKTMGHDADQVPVPCALWQERLVFNAETKQVEPVRACYFHHDVVLAINQIQSTEHVRASTDEVRKELAFIRGLATPQPEDPPSPILEVEKSPNELPAGGMNGRPRLS